LCYTDCRSAALLLFECAGIDGEPVVFLFSDTQIVSESFLEDINNLLNSGEVPGMFAQVRARAGERSGSSAACTAHPGCVMRIERF
jgi:hypothetical protein